MKKIIYIDLDNVIVDFPSAFKTYTNAELNLYEHEYNGEWDNVPGIFSRMKLLPGAIDAINKLIESNLYEIYLLSTAPWENPSAWSDKLIWVKNNLPSYFYKRLILSHNKNLNCGDFLIDDRTKNGADKFQGTLIYFNPKTPEVSWNEIIKKLL